MTTILAAVDFSKSTDRVVGVAVDLACAFSGKVTLMHVVRVPGKYGTEDGPDTIRSAIATVERSADLHLQLLADRVRKMGCPVETRRSTGKTVNLLVDASLSLSAKLIVMGSHGHTALSDATVGPTTEGVLRSARCPVVIVTRPNGVSSLTPEVGGLGERHQVKPTEAVGAPG